MFRGRADVPARENAPAAAAGASASITPKLTPLPPCTAMPAGLLTTSRRIVLIDDRQLEPSFGAGNNFFGRWQCAGAEHASMSPLCRRYDDVDTLAIQPDLAATDDAVDMALGHSLAEA
jgi:hypothetical protein